MKNKIFKIGFLLLTIVPFLYMIYFMSSFGDTSMSSEEFDTRFKLHTYVIFYMWGLMAIYIVTLFKSTAVPKDKKALWAVVLFMGNIISMPVYWYLYIWKEPKNS